VSTDDGDRHDSEFASTLLGGSGAADHPGDHRDELGPAYVARPRRADRHRKKRRRGRRLIPLLSILVVIVLCIGGYVLVRKVTDGLGTQDFKGAGSGSVIVEVKTGDGSSQIGSTLKKNDVVASQAAFVKAAKASGRSQEFQAGFFKLRKQMSGTEAVALLLNVAESRVSSKVTVTEGMILPDVLALLAKNLNLPLADLQAASKDIPNLGLPDGFTATNAEGFLFPQTYQFDPNTNASRALQTLTSQFESEVRTLNFSADAAKLGVSAYQALIIASMIEAETKFDEDRAKVARVVYNRLASNTPLGFDTTTAYDYKLQGKDPTTATYTEDSPYNTRTHTGLPPTPIGNPGAKSMTAAVEPATGDWLYFVSADAAGHLFFTNDYNAFLVASQACIDNKWGCN
jgi:UPF0755 protein